MSSKPGAVDSIVNNITNYRRREEQQRRRQEAPEAAVVQIQEQCTECDAIIPAGSADDWTAHYNEKHALESGGDPDSIAKRKLLIQNHLSKNSSRGAPSRGAPPQATRDSQPGPKLPQTPADNNSNQPPRPTTSGLERPLKSPGSTRSLKRDADEKAAPPKRSRARVPTQTIGNRNPDEEFRREPTQKSGKLWNPDDDPPSRRGSKQRDGGSAEGSGTPGPARTFEPRPAEPDNTELMIKQPETRPISQEQLVAEVKGIYAGLVMVESKCIEVDNAQSSTSEDSGPKLNNEQWQALIALHRTLLHEHHDFFLASQHPSASPALRRLASKYAMPARIMAIEDDDIKDREVWTAVSRHWYSKASDKAPTTGRLYHHLAILARPNALQQLFYYTKSLCVSIPFLSARESIMTLFEPHLSGAETRIPEIDAAFIRAHVDEFIGKLDNHISRTTERWMKNGYHIGIAQGCALLEYGSESNVIMRHIKSGKAGDADVVMEGTEAGPSKKFLDALDFTARTQDVILRRVGDPNVATYVHVTLSFLDHMSKYPSAMSYIEEKMEWKRMALLLNTLLDRCASPEMVDSDAFPRPEDPPRPLPDDFAQRGLLWVDKYYPDNWFTAAKIDDEDKYFEVASMEEERRVRCLWLGRRLASSNKWLTYDEEARQFWVVAKYDHNFPEAPPRKDESRPDGDGDLGIPDAPVVHT
ncbi:Telomerase-binding protein EST1A [Colletotrichum karsti]|uniref:Telomerase-binding protein EST1A n=1 Tax=Colletotrichum karsti TaxID=1095194 RepID=A0A9P6IBS4_9PEZI|nr:Telomerase-binding protein EST1A [Colletotrichum karsti]KAF9879594.1 Telomerase-binding protein EST1A [Colletotrichum karsti]